MHRRPQRDAFGTSSTIITCAEETSMRTPTILMSAGLMTLVGITLAPAQGNPVQGAPGSAFPHAARHEVQMIGGVPCRTVLVKGTNTRVPVECAGQATTG